MVELHYLYMLLYAVAGVLALAVVVVAWRRRAAREALPLAALMLGVAIWAGGYAVMWCMPTLDQQVFWSRTTSLGSWLVPVGFLTLAFEIAGMKRWLTPGRIALIASASFALNNIEWLNPGRLFEAAIVARTIGSFTYYQIVWGPLYWVFVAYAYALILLATVIIFRMYLRSTGIRRTRAVILLIGGLVPTVVTVVAQVGFLPLGIDSAPIAFLATGALWLFAILRGGLFDIVPLARGALVEQMRDGVVLVDGDGLVVDANSAALSMLDAPSAEVLGRPAEAVFSAIAGANALLGESEPQRCVLSLETDGGQRYIELGVTPLVVGPGRAPAQLVTLQDVTDERRRTDQLKLASTVFETTNEGILVLLPGQGGRIVDVNSAFCRMTGYAREDIVNTSARRFLSEDRMFESLETMQEILAAEGEWRGELEQTRADGTVFPAWVSMAASAGTDERDTSAICVVTDLTEIRQAEITLQFNATHDALTGLPNRILLSDRLEHALAYATRVGRGVAVLFIDLDNFKGINDTLGHAQGDALLVAVAERITGALRESDTVGRFGGDEFTVVLADVEDALQVETATQRLLEAMGRTFRLGVEDVHVSASIGVSLFPTDSTDATSLMQHADLAMYGAKALGRSRVQFFSEELQVSMQRLRSIEEELWGALDEDRYFLLYQPQVDLSTGRITGVEALARLRTREGAVMSPTDFIPIAENSELIVLLGDWVMRKACADLAIMQEVTPGLTMSVNFSVRQFREMDVTALLGDVLSDSGVEAQSIKLEITETAFLLDAEEAQAKFAQLRDVVGVGLALDDFGTGYSSLTYVRMFRANTIKIDCSFVELLPDDLEARAVVLSIIALAKSLGAVVVAEGPETEEQVRFLRANGCDVAQGFYFSHPIPTEELILLLGRGPYSLPDI
ncbi:MAG: EAL domain-containing protein [Coriobacteriia bacterium]|nr:EAL domain-containing protein [Coriobacteriia bacterium]